MFTKRQIVTIAAYTLLLLLCATSAGLLADEKKIDPLLSKIEYLAETKQITHLIEFCVDNRKQMKQVHAEPLYELASGLFIETKEIAEEKHTKSFSDRRAYWPKHKGDIIVETEDFWYQNTVIVEQLRLNKPTPIAGKWLWYQLAVVSSEVDIVHTMSPSDSILMTNAESVDLDYHTVSRCVVISSGDILKGRLSNSTVIANGNIYFDGTGGSFLESKNKIYYHKDANALLRENVTLPRDNVYRENSKDLFGLKFYSVAEHGLEVSQDKDKVAVKTVKEKTPFGEAGLQVGDVITHINGSKVPSAHELNRLSSRAIVTTSVGKLTLQRGMDKVELNVKFPPIVVPEKK